jgi:hypothetical protein
VGRAETGKPGPGVGGSRGALSSPAIQEGFLEERMAQPFTEKVLDREQKKSQSLEKIVNRDQG